MLEFYCNRTVCFQWGPHIFATYGLFGALGGAAQVLCTTGWLHACARAKRMPPLDARALACVGIATTAATLLGWRTASMFLEDAHLLRARRYWSAWLRPGLIEAGGAAAIATLTAAVSALLVWRRDEGASAPAVFGSVADAMTVGYYAANAFVKLGCVTYGCCWGVPLARRRWYATTYSNERSKCCRIRPDLRGVPLFPVSTLIACMSLRNVVCAAWAATSGWYVPGLVTAVAPCLSVVDRRVYFPLRGDAPCEAACGTVHPVEHCRVVAPREKHLFCTRWSRPARAVALAAAAGVAVGVCRKDVVALPLGAPPWADVAGATLVAAASYALFLGYHYGRLGQWVPRRAD